ncbi:2-amino-4-hydroxy-6-hydroxymethyldihydropteridine diphosphokinase [Candidatus Latescibacterota bacterium]
MIKAYLGLGSNIGDRFGHLKEAVFRLNASDGIKVTAYSAVYETDPVGGPEQPDFLNAVVEIETTLDTGDLLDRCLETEHEMGRKREVLWGPRTIDIDVLLFGGELEMTERLTVPHPHMCERAFVLVPLADIAPDAVHPLTGTTICELLTTVDYSGIRRTGLSLVPDESTIE